MAGQMLICLWTFYNCFISIYKNTILKSHFLFHLFLSLILLGPLQELTGCAGDPEGIQAVAFLHLEEIFCPNLWFDDKIKEATYSLAYTIPVTRVRRQEEADTREAAATSPQRP